MEIIEIDINKLQPDPIQPRKTMDEEDLREMAQSIVTEGVINPIEVDEEMVIITGERRWRASKIAGLAKVPVKVMNLKGNERFMRQVIENVHNNTMSDWDTAIALGKLISFSPGEKHPQAPKTGPTKTIGITWLSGKMGKSVGYIEEKLSLLKASPKVQKAIREGKLSSTFIRAINKVPKKFKEGIEKKVLAGEFSARDSALEFAAAIEREQDSPDAIERLMEIDYSQHKTPGEASAVIRKISPRTADYVKKSYEPSQELSRIVDAAKNWVHDNPMPTIGKIHLPRVIVNMNYLKTLHDKWFESGKGSKISPTSQRLLESKK